MADKDAKVCISALGFKEVCLPAGSFKQQNHTIFLEPANLQLATVEVKALSAENLVKEAIQRIPENYADKPVRYTYYQRQTQETNDKPAFLIESVNEAYRSHPKMEHQLSIKKSRGLAADKKFEAEMNDKNVGLFVIITNDDLLSFPDYLHPSKSKNYVYTFDKEAIIGIDTVFVVAFNPKANKNGIEAPGFKGKMFLHKNSKAIVRLEKQDNESAIAKENNGLTAKIIMKDCKCLWKFSGLQTVVNYKKIGSRWYISEFYGHSSDETSGGKYPVPERKSSTTHLVVTHIQPENPQEIPEGERIKSYRNYYNTAPKDMNETYWQQYNVIPLPTVYQQKLAQ